MADVRVCIEASASLMAAMRHGSNLQVALDQVGVLSPDQIVLTAMLFRTEPKRLLEPNDSTLDETRREDVRAAMRQVIRERAQTELPELDDALGNIGPRDLIAFVTGNLPKGVIRSRLEELIVTSTLVLQIIGRLSKAVPEPSDAVMAELPVIDDEEDG